MVESTILESKILIQIMAIKKGKSYDAFQHVTTKTSDYTFCNANQKLQLWYPCGLQQKLVISLFSYFQWYPRISDLWLYSQRKDEANSTHLQPTQRNCCSHKDAKKNTKVKVLSLDEDTDYFDIVAGVLQGDTLAPYLFIICVDYMLRTSIDKIKENGFKLKNERCRRYPTQTITNTNYADDIALLANTPAQAKSLLHSQ